LCQQAQAPTAAPGQPASRGGTATREPKTFLKKRKLYDEKGGDFMPSITRTIAVIAVAMGLIVSCTSTASLTKEEREALLKKAQASRQEWNKVDPQLEAFAKKGHGFVFFPEITKGGLVVGGAGGHGVVYEQDQHIGYADITQMSFGLQAGGQTYSELIVFENKAAMDRFKRNEIDFGANASAVIAEKGAATGAQFVDGVAVFIKPIGGAMAEASLGGQQIAYVGK
jgi:lipid-binding SYLF domain-containing protein